MCVRTLWKSLRSCLLSICPLLFLVDLVFGRALPYNVHTFRSRSLKTYSALPRTLAERSQRVADRFALIVPRFNAVAHCPTDFCAPAAFPSAHKPSPQRESPSWLTKGSATFVALSVWRAPKLLVARPHGKCKRDRELPPPTSTQVRAERLLSPPRECGFRDRTKCPPRPGAQVVARQRSPERRPGPFWPSQPLEAQRPQPPATATLCYGCGADARLVGRHHQGRVRRDRLDSSADLGMTYAGGCEASGRLPTPTLPALTSRRPKRHNERFASYASVASIGRAPHS
jgi:hypothetical protein